MPTTTLLVSDFNLNSDSDEYAIGLDLGKFSDYTALAGLRAVMRDGRKIFQVVALKRWPLNTPYTEIVASVRAGMSRPPWRGCTVLIDRGGVGIAVAEMFQGAGLNPIMVQFTAGDAINCKGREWHIAKNELVSVIDCNLYLDALHINPLLPHADILRDELQNFRSRITASGNLVQSHREGAHDDLVFAVAMPLFYLDGRGSDKSFSHWMEFMHGGGLSGRAKSAPAAQPRVLLKQFKGGQASQVYTLSGEMVHVQDGVIAVLPNDVPPLLQGGWSLVTQ